MPTSASACRSTAATTVRACDILARPRRTRVRLMTNNPDKVRALADHGITVVEQVPHEAMPGNYNRGYLIAKRDRLGHTLQRVG